MDLLTLTKTIADRVETEASLAILEAGLTLE
jgi:hypothetical protein